MASLVAALSPADITRYYPVVDPYQVRQIIPRVVHDHRIKLPSQIETSPRRHDLTLSTSTVPPSPAWSSSALVSPATTRSPSPPSWTGVA
jgi:hypothetical protein